MTGPEPPGGPPGAGIPNAVKPVPGIAPDGTPPSFLVDANGDINLTDSIIAGRDVSQTTNQTTNHSNVNNKKVTKFGNGGLPVIIALILALGAGTGAAIWQLSTQSSTETTSQAPAEVAMTGTLTTAPTFAPTTTDPTTTTTAAAPTTEPVATTTYVPTDPPLGDQPYAGGFQTSDQGGDKMNGSAYVGGPVTAQSVPTVMSALSNCGFLDMTSGAGRALAVPFTLLVHLDSSVAGSLSITTSAQSGPQNDGMEIVATTSDGPTCSGTTSLTWQLKAFGTAKEAGWVVFFNAVSPAHPTGDPAVLSEAALAFGLVAPDGTIAGADFTGPRACGGSLGDPDAGAIEIVAAPAGHGGCGANSATTTNG
jgi:hypothetical protein